MKVDRKKIVAALLISVAISFLIYKKVTCSSCISYDIARLHDKNNLMAVVIIGSGPAGYAAALYTARAGYPTVIVEGPMAGGQLTQTSYVENWPGEQKILGNELMNKQRQQVEAFGVQFMADSVEKVDLTTWPFEITTSDGNTLTALSVIVATGSTPKKLHAPGEKEYWGKGVTTCATCDAPFYKGRDVVVVGGGDSAAEEALQLAAHARSVEILVRKDKMRASKAMLDAIARIDIIKISYNKEIKKIGGNDVHVKEIEIYDSKTKQTYKQEIDGVFLAIGHDPNTKLFKGQLAMDEAGYLIMQGRSQQTTMPGVFAAGDVEDHTYRQAGVAAGRGIQAALDAGMFLQSIGVDHEILRKIEDRLFTAKRAQVHLDEITTQQELQNLSRDNELVFIDFYGTSCPPCKAMMPVVERISAQFGDAIKFVKVNVAEAKELVMKYKVARIPTFVITRSGQEIARKNGIVDRKKMATWLQEVK